MKEMKTVMKPWRKYTVDGEFLLVYFLNKSKFDTTFKSKKAKKPKDASQKSYN